MKPDIDRAPRTRNAGRGVVFLAKCVTVDQYRKMERDRDRNGISSFIYERFYERHIAPHDYMPEQKRTGFSVMGDCCLMIEALESFFQGWENTRARGMGNQAFSSFFARVPELKDFAGIGFYKHIRCGILHQAETTGGWLLRRGSGKLIDPSNKTIDADLFLGVLKKYLRDYTNSLRVADWESDVWRNLRKKMQFVIDHCGTDTGDE